MQLDFTLVFAYWHVLLKGLGYLERRQNLAVQR